MRNVGSLAVVVQVFARNLIGRERKGVAKAKKDVGGALEKGNSVKRITGVIWC